jgi:UDP-glucose 4-epimerase
LQVLAAFKKTTEKDIPYVIKGRRTGDVAESYADPALANQLLDWKTTKTLDIMCADHWHWQQQNPLGYES